MINTPMTDRDRVEAAGTFLRKNTPADSIQNAVEAVAKIGRELDALIADIYQNPNNPNKVEDTLPCMSLNTALHEAPQMIHDHCSYSIQRIHDLRSLLLS